MTAGWAVAVLVTACLWAAVACGEDDGNGNGVQANGRLRVDGSRLLNERGEPVQLRGMSSHGIVWFPQYANARALMDLKSRGANLFRIAMYADSGLGGYCQDEEARKNSVSLMRLALENTLAADMYAIVDWHILKDENPLPTVNRAIEFFDGIAAHYGNNPAIIYEICNEPNGAVTWDDIYLYAEQVIPVIRRHAPDAVILVGTPHWCFNVLDARAKPLPHENIMYAFHMYTGYTDYEYVEILDTMRADNLPVFVSEWGVSRDKSGVLDVDEGWAFVEYMRRHRISWANWSLCNKDEDFSVVKPSVEKLHGWTEEDLTESGKLVFSALSGE